MLIAQLNKLVILLTGWLASKKIMIMAVTLATLLLNTKNKMVLVSYHRDSKVQCTVEPV